MQMQDQSAIPGTCCQCHRETYVFGELCRQCYYVYIRTLNKTVDDLAAKDIIKWSFGNFDLED